MTAPKDPFDNAQELITSLVARVENIAKVVTELQGDQAQAHAAAVKAKDRAGLPAPVPGQLDPFMFLQVYQSGQKDATHTLTEFMKITMANQSSSQKSFQDGVKWSKDAIKEIAEELVEKYDDDDDGALDKGEMVGMLIEALPKIIAGLKKPNGAAGGLHALQALANADAGGQAGRHASGDKE